LAALASFGADGVDGGRLDAEDDADDHDVACLEGGLEDGEQEEPTGDVGRRAAVAVCR